MRLNISFVILIPEFACDKTTLEDKYVFQGTNITPSSPPAKHMHTVQHILMSTDLVNLELIWLVLLPQQRKRRFILTHHIGHMKYQADPVWMCVLYTGSLSFESMY